jgi:ribosomal protein S14
MSGPAEAVRQRARNRCEYCGLPQGAFRRGFHIEHIVARQHGGSTSLDNLAFACWTCNLKKGPSLSGIDPATVLVTALFHPREHDWPEHFSAHVATLMPLGIEIRGLTPVGRATVRVLALNEEMRQMARYEFWREGLYTIGA